MKKIININLSGRVIPIEDSAYEMLQAYIESLRRYFMYEDGKDEIINDIESRIAEIMSEKVRKGSTAIVDTDVQEIIASMGRVEDFEEADKETTEPKISATAHDAGYDNVFDKKMRKGRLYRDSSDKIIGGVCSGMAYYLNIDPSIIRILFAIITFGGFGLGVVVYVVLWIVLPPRAHEGYTGKRLYRNPDDKVISGVAGGLAAYFNRSASAVRLIFAAPLLLNIIFGILSFPFFHEGSIFPNIVFGSLTGTFILAYIVLWIVLPEASSDYQKMEMRGEKIDVNRIRQNVREGVNSSKERMKEWAEEATATAKNFGAQASQFASTRGRSFAAEAKETAQRGGQGFLRVLGVLFKAFFLFIAGTIAFALFVGLIGLIIGGVGVWPLRNFVLDGFWQNLYAWGTLILFLGVPLIGFIVWLLRRLTKVKSQHSYFGWVFGGLWALGWICASLFAASLVNDFRMSNYKRDAQELSIVQPANGKMIVTVNEPEVEYSGSIPWIDIDGEGIDITRDTLKISNVVIDDVIMSEDSNYHVQIKKYSRGRTVPEAEMKAQKVQFNASSKDSMLDLSSHIAIDKQTKFRGQKVIVIISVPKGKKIRFDESVEKLHSFNVNLGDDNRWDRRRRRDWNFDDNSFSYKTNVEYTMGAGGELISADGSTKLKSKNPDYRYEQEAVSDSTDLERSIEKKKQELKQLEEKRTKQTKPVSKKTKKQNEMEPGFAAGPNAPALTEWF